jgi:hypothetical protein
MMGARGRRTSGSSGEPAPKAPQKENGLPSSGGLAGGSRRLPNALFLSLPNRGPARLPPGGHPAYASITAPQGRVNIATPLDCAPRPHPASTMQPTNKAAEPQTSRLPPESRTVWERLRTRRSRCRTAVGAATVTRYPAHQQPLRPSKSAEACPSPPRPFFVGPAFGASAPLRNAAQTACPVTRT